MAMDDPRYALGFDLGGTKLMGVIVDRRDARVLAERTVPTVFEENDLVDTLTGLAEHLITEAQTSMQGRVAAAGLGAPGLVDRAGVLRYGANLPGVIDAPLAARLSERIGVPVAADNDAACAA